MDQRLLVFKGDLVAERCHLSGDFASSRPTCFCSAHAEVSLALSLAIEFGISKLVKF
jgi:hypothetical protein